MLVHMPKETNTRMWTAALPGIAKAICYPRQKQTGVWEWLNELMCLHGGTLCSTAASSPLCDRSPGKLSKDIDVWISFPEILI